MLTKKDIQLKLLRKFNELCDEANVKYALHGQGALLAYQNEPIDRLKELEVMMCQGDAEKISKLLDDDDFYFEDFRTNPKFDIHLMMFGYRDSLDLKMRDVDFRKSYHIENNCIHINIQFIEHLVSGKTKQILDLERKAWKLKNFDLETNHLWYLNYSKKALNAFHHITGNGRTINRRYKTKKDNYSIWTWDDIEKYQIVSIGENKIVNSNLFKDIIETDLEGIPTYILKDFERYAEFCYGENWPIRIWKSPYKYTSTLINWEEYSSIPEIQESMDKMQELYEEIYSNSIKARRAKVVIANMKDHVKQSGRVIHRREEYIEQKEEILKLYEDGNIDELNLIFKPLVEAMEKGVKLGYTFSVDDEIDEIFDSYLRKVDQEKMADKIKKLRIDI